MTEAFASAVAVTIPILALAASTEARSIRERIKTPNEKWEREFAKHQAEHDLDLDASGKEIAAYFKEIPGLSSIFMIERVLAIAGALVWVATFSLLAIAELRTLDWLADGEPAGQSGLAGFSMFCIGLTMVVLIAAPMLYILVPLFMPLDLVPESLKKAVVPKVVNKKGRGLLKEIISDFDGIIDRAVERYEAHEGAAEGTTEAEQSDPVPTD